MRALIQALVVIVAWGFAEPVMAGEAGEVVTRLQTSLLQVMKEGKQLGYDGRYAHLEPVIRRTHDLAFVARLSLGKHWSGLSEDERHTLIDIFSRLSIATYASRFDRYQGERFVVDSEKTLPRGNMRLVESRLVKSDGDAIHFNYLVHPGEKRWRIVNIIVNGVSDLALKRAEYTDVLEKEGFPALVATLERQIRQYADESHE